MMFSDETYGRGRPEKGNDNVSCPNPLTHRYLHVTRRRRVNRTRRTRVSAIRLFKRLCVRVLHLFFDRSTIERQSERPTTRL